jgi:hypothetical protein
MFLPLPGVLKMRIGSCSFFRSLRFEENLELDFRASERHRSGQLPRLEDLSKEVLQLLIEACVNSPSPHSQHIVVEAELMGQSCERTLASRYGGELDAVAADG